MKKRGRYTKEFKLEAVRLLKEGAKPASELAMELGVRRVLLYRWKDELEKHGDDSFSGKTGPKKDQQTEITRLKQEINGTQYLISAHLSKEDFFLASCSCSS